VLPAITDLTAYRGDTWTQEFRLLEDTVPVDLTGASVECWAVRSAGSRLELEVTVGPDPGVITLRLPADAEAGNYRYDVEVTDAGGDVTTWIRGRLDVIGDVTNG
jgi:hypothetical protein